jgi:hypothetical protein
VAPAKAVDDRSTILQLAIDLPQMNGYWHIDVRPDRVPLKVAPHPDLPAPLGLVKFGEAVVVETDAPLRFERIVVAGDSARVGYRYEPEGLIVDVRLESDDAGWHVVDAQIAER